jgi:FAD/FMN-containing dehydrogenase
MRRSASRDLRVTVRGQPETGLLLYSDAELADLLDGLAGSVQQPGLPGYNDARMGFMHTAQHFPQLIVNCVCTTDVVAALAFARRTGLKVTARSGGHSTAGYSVNDQIVVDVSGISYVLVDREARRARVGAGTNFRKLNLVLDAVGLHVPGGGCESVCVAGYMQGGGYGFTSRLFGMNCDLVEAVTLVLADGRVVRAHAGENEDLFWAVRGGTGNQFGVLVEIEYRLVELGDLFGFGLRFPLDGAAGRAGASRVLADLQSGYTLTGPERMGMQALLINLPDASSASAQHPNLILRGLYNGSEAEAKAALGPLLEHVHHGGGSVEIWTRGRYCHLNEILLQSVEPPGIDLPSVSMNTKPLVDSRIVADLHGPERWCEVIDHFLASPDRTSFIALELYGGAINARAPDETAFVHRRASLDLFAWAFWTFEANAHRSIAWLDRFAAIAGAMGNGRRYQNYPRRGYPDFRQEYFGENLDRLMAVKRRSDPHNLFAFEEGLLPADAAEREDAA